MSGRVCNTCIIILGQRLNHNGDLPDSLRNRVKLGLKLYARERKLSSRLKTEDATDCDIDNDRKLRNGENNVLLILSGADTCRYGVSEARVMQDYIESLGGKNLTETDSGMDIYLKDDISAYTLMDGGEDLDITEYPRVKRDDIILEENSNNTIENALCCKPILESMEISSPFKLCIITNEFHIPRTEFIFRSMVSTLPRNELIDLQFFSAASHLPTNIFRKSVLRPMDMNDWSLLERLEVEMKSVSNIQDILRSNQLPPVSETIYNALLGRLNEAFENLSKIYIDH